jgi:hypothetical protein
LLLAGNALEQSIMRKIDRFNLTDLIGRELQARMSYADIDAYLKGYGIDAASKKTSGTNSKWVYTKEVLADESDETILTIADELQIDHPYHGPKHQDLSDSKFWLPGHFRLFLSHLASFKDPIMRLRAALRRLGITAFVAHEDIEPTKEWLNEIEKALFSMDALAAVLMPGFHESHWTDHEVGIAVGRDVLVIPVCRGVVPYGFISKYQGFQTNGKLVSQVADGIFRIVLRSPKTKGRMLDCLIDQLLLAASESDALSRLELLGRAESISEVHSAKIRAGVPSNAVLWKSEEVLGELNTLLTRHGLARVEAPRRQEASEDDIPF